MFSDLNPSFIKDDMAAVTLRSPTPATSPNPNESDAADADYEGDETESVRRREGKVKDFVFNISGI